MLTDAPTAPVPGVIPVIVGGGTIVKLNPLLATPPAAVTTKLPLVAVDGTTAIIELAPQVLAVAVNPLNLTLPFPCVAPKFDPDTVTMAPVTTGLGDAPLMLGAEVTVKVVPELD
jgi:hypothetical protein